jgi:hypothetical protein
MRAVMRGSIAYSIEIVTLSNSTLSGPEQCEALAEYLDGLLRPVLEAPVPPLHFSITDLDTMLDEASQQTRLLDALSSTQPIVNEVARAMSEIIDDANMALDDMTGAIRNTVEEDTIDLVEAIDKVRRDQVTIINSIFYLGRYRQGEKEAIDSLMMTVPSLRETVKDPENPSPEDLLAMENRLIFILNALRDFREQMTPDLELYWKQQRELDEITKTYKAALRKAQVAMIAWSRAHQRLAAGITDPAKIDVLGLAKKAAGAASPL